MKLFRKLNLLQAGVVVACMATGQASEHELEFVGAYQSLSAGVSSSGPYSKTGITLGSTVGYFLTPKIEPTIGIAFTHTNESHSDNESENTSTKLQFYPGIAYNL